MKTKYSPIFQLYFLILLFSSKAFASTTTGNTTTEAVTEMHFYLPLEIKVYPYKFIGTKTYEEIDKPFFTSNNLCKKYWTWKIDGIRFQNTLKQRVWQVVSPFFVTPFLLKMGQHSQSFGKYPTYFLAWSVPFLFGIIFDDAVFLIDLLTFGTLSSTVENTLKVKELMDNVLEEAMNQCDQNFPE